MVWNIASMLVIGLFIIGSSKGLFNTPVLISDKDSYISGDSAKLTCNVSSTNETLTYGFLRNGMLINNNQSGNNIYIINKISTNQDGNYSCSVTAGNETKRSKNETIKVTLPVSISVDGFIIGGNVTLTCHVPTHETNLTFMWLENNTKLPDKTLSNITIQSVTEHRNGTMYSCNALSSNGIMGNASTELIIYYSPSVTITSSNLIKADTSGTVLLAKVKSNPSSHLNITWFENGNQLVGKEYAWIEFDFINKSMDGFVYVCRVMDQFGSDEASVKLIVYDSTDIKISVSNHQPYENQQITITCRSRDELNITKWRLIRNSEVIEETTSSTFNTLPNNTHVNSYQCQGVNDVTIPIIELTSQAVEVEVKESPTSPVISADNDTYTSGDSLNLTCIPPFSMNLDQNITYVFKHNDIVISQSERSFYVNSKLSSKDNGNYSCIMKVVNKTIASDNEITIEITLPVSIVVNGSIIGGNVTLTCHVPTHETNLTFMWFENNTQLPDEKFSNLILQAVNKSLNNTMYSCNALSPNGVMGKASTLLYLYERPSINIIGLPYVQAGSNTTLECRINSNDGNSNLNITWLENGNRLDGEKGYLIVLELVNKSMDGFIYTCHIENQLKGTDEDSIQLIVYDSSDITISVSKQNPIEGESIRVTCQSRDQLNITKWRLIRNNEAIMENNETAVFDIMPNGTFVNLYQCQGINDVTDPIIELPSKVVYVTVKSVHSTPVLVNRSNTTSSGSRLALMCSVDTFSQNTSFAIAYRFFKNGKLIDNLPTNQSLLVIDPLLTKDSGVYQCSARSNKTNKMSNKVDVKVLLEVRVFSMKIIIGENVTFKCKIYEGEENVTFSWYVNQSPLPGQTSQELLLTKVGRSDNGNTYTCVASSYGISGNDSGILSVMEPISVSTGTYSYLNGVFWFLEDTLAVLSCPFDNSTYNWFKDDVLILENGNKTYITDSIKQNDEGSYTCSDSKNASFSSPFQIQVFTLKNVNLTLSVEGKIIGNEMALICTSFSSADTQIIRWKFYEDDVLFADTQSNNALKKITSLKSSFHCETVSNWTISVNSTKVMVMAKAFAGVNITTNQSLPVHGDTVQLTCQVKENPAVQVTTWKFYQDHQLVKNSLDDNIVITNFSSEDAGSYHCEAVSNWTDSLNSTMLKLAARDAAVVSVQSATHIIDKYQLAWVHNNTELVLFCNSSLTTPSYIWYRNGEDLNMNTEILNLTLKTGENGTYSCNDSSMSMNQITVNVFTLTTVNIGFSPEAPFEGDPMTLTCTSDSQSIKEWRFYKTNPTVPLYVGPSNRHTINSVIGTVGYFCEAHHSNNLDNRMSAIKTLIATVLFDVPTISLSKKSSETGNELTLNCSTTVHKTQERASYQILRNGVEISTEQSVVISPIRTEHNGTYSCNATVKTITKTSLAKDFQVRLALDLPNNMSVLENNNAEIVCTVSGGEEVTHSWYVNGTLLPGESSNTLSLSKVSRQKQGYLYKCSGRSSNGIIGESNEMKLIVLYLDKPAIQGSTTINEGNTLSLECISTAFPAITNYQWYNGSIAIDNQTSSTLSIRQMKRVDSGEYKCRVTNPGGSTISDPVTVTVLYIDQPNIEANPKLPIIEGSNLLLNCIVSTDGLRGNPVTYQWTKNGNQTVLSTSAGYSLTSIERAAAGIYRCQVSSSGIEVSSEIKVIVHYTPSGIDIIRPVSSDEIRLNQQTSITCLLTDLGLPEGNLTLFKDSQQIQTIKPARPSDHLIFGITAKTRDTGSYKCVGHNYVGNVTSQIKKIIVIEPPGVVTGIFSSFNSRHIFLGWTAPFNGNKPILRYNVTYRDLTLPNAEPITVSTTKLSINLTIAIFPDRNYTAFVVAINELGASNKSIDILLKTKESLPTEPRSLMVKPNNEEKTLFILWSQPNPTNGDIINYKVCWRQVKDDGVAVTTSERCLDVGKVLMKQLTGLKAFSEYVIQVTATNGAGEGNEATGTGTTLEEKPEAVRNIAHQTTNDSATLTWQKPIHVFGILTGYSVSFKIASSSNSLTPVLACQKIKVTTCTIPQLQAFKNYSIEISVSNSRNTTKTVVMVTTKTGPPPPFSGAVPVPSKDDITTSSFKIRLVEFDEINGPIKEYIVVVKRLSSSSVPSQDPSVYTQKDIEDGKDGIFVAMVVTNRALFGKVVEIKSTSTAAKRKRRAIKVVDFTLEEDTFYTVFVRGVTTDNQFQTTTWYTPIQLASDGLDGGAIAGIVVAVILLLFLAAVLWYFLYYKRRHPKEDGKVVKMTSIQKRRSIKVPTIDPHVPVTANLFEDHVNQRKANGNFGFSQEYSMISRELEYPYHQSRIQENNIKNRYHNVPAYDDTRVMLEVIDGEHHTDYINANYIDGYERNREYIATQGPLPETVFDFWRMIWESETTTIVMLTRLEEKGRVKCAQYWPNNGNLALKDILITNTDIQDFPDHVVRTFHVTRTGQAIERNIRQFHFIAWPDFGVPDDPTALLAFIRKVNNWREMTPSGPAVIHCSAGVGRTGTYITIDSQINSLKAKNELQVFKNVRLLRQQRCLMVQTEDQYVFIHNALLDYMESGETEVDANELREYVRKHSESERSGMTGLMEEFIRLAKADRNDQYTHANKAVNHAKNRYKNIFPFDATRVKLSQRPGVEGSDYINANYIDSYGYKDYFIATQAPLESTVGDFWRMIWEQDCGTIVMLTKEFEGQQAKVYPYWPQKGSPKIGLFIVETTSETTYGDYIVREMKLTNTEASMSRKVKQFQYKTWPESGSPESGVGIIELIGQVQKWNTSINNGVITVHCSTGVGRTGVFIALTNLIERVKLEGVVDVYQTVKKMRQQRTAMVQTKDQYEFCYRALQEYLESFDVYANLH